MSYAITLPSGKVEHCSKPGNCRRHGAYANSAVPTDKAQFMRDMEIGTATPLHLREGDQFPPVVVPYNDLNEPQPVISADALAYKYELGTNPLDPTQPVDYNDFAALNRNNTVDNLRIREVDIERVLPAIFARPFEALPKTLVNLANQIGVADPANWRLNVNSGYYGEEVDTAELAPKQINALRTWYYSQPNARDKDGILAYCRSKGLDTAGFTPLAAIQHQLAQENPGRTHPSVDQAWQVSAAQLRHNRVEVPRHDRLTAITARPAEVPTELAGSGTQKIIGVIAVRQGRYMLVDGYHRYKDALESGTQTGRYIMLTGPYSAVR